MQDRYAGDLGDYFKLSLLRALTAGGRAGVIWYRTEDKRAPGDGGLLGYLWRNDWASYDPGLHAELKAMVVSDNRSITGLEKILGNQYTFFDEPMPSPADRSAWFVRAFNRVKNESLTFVDPDNGIAPPGWKASVKGSIKSVTIEEIRTLAGAWRSVLVYHHHTRLAGGHRAEIESIAARCGFQSVLALRTVASSPRSFILINADRAIYQRAIDYAAKWNVPSRKARIELFAFGTDPRDSPLAPDSPYSDEAERREERFVDGLYDGKHPALFDPNRDYTLP